MNASRLIYRSRQFWQTITARSSPDDMDLVSSVLSSSQFELFQLMQRSEQIHGIRVLKSLKKMGHENTDLQTAALLHDVGKIRAPLRSWERALIVVVKAICPDCVRRWGSAPIKESVSSLGWRRSFIVAEQHPAWSAALAAQCGTSEMAVSLIARHQEQLQPEKVNEHSAEDRLLRILQVVDNIS